MKSKLAHLYRLSHRTFGEIVHKNFEQILAEVIASLILIETAKGIALQAAPINRVVLLK